MISAALAAALLLTSCSVRKITEPSETETSVPETTVTTPTETTVPVTETIVPETTVPETTVSETTVTKPPVTDPPATGPLDAFDTEKHGWGQGINVDEYNRPTGSTWAQSLYGEHGAVYIMPETDGARLTFDLGYEYGCTGRILDTLAKKGVHATFFVTTDYVRANPELTARIINEGHVLGNHSVHHYSMPELTVAEMKEEITGLHNYVRDTYGYEMFLFRPPKGEFSEQSLEVAKSLGYTSVFWSFAYLDYDTANQPAVQSAYASVTGAAHKGAVYLLHGVSETNTAILGDVIDYLNTTVGIVDGW